MFFQCNCWFIMFNALISFIVYFYILFTSYFITTYCTLHFIYRLQIKSLPIDIHIKIIHALSLILTLFTLNRTRHARFDQLLKKRRNININILTRFTSSKRHFYYTWDKYYLAILFFIIKIR